MVQTPNTDVIPTGGGGSNKPIVPPSPSLPTTPNTPVPLNPNSGSDAGTGKGTGGNDNPPSPNTTNIPSGSGVRATSIVQCFNVDFGPDIEWSFIYNVGENTSQSASISVTNKTISHNMFAAVQTPVFLSSNVDAQIIPPLSSLDFIITLNSSGSNDILMQGKNSINDLIKVFCKMVNVNEPVLLS